MPKRASCLYVVLLLVHCKTCSIKTPTQDITWTVPEGGGGPLQGSFPFLSFLPFFLSLFPSLPISEADRPLLLVSLSLSSSHLEMMLARHASVSILFSCLSLLLLFLVPHSIRFASLSKLSMHPYLSYDPILLSFSDGSAPLIDDCNGDFRIQSRSASGRYDARQRTRPPLRRLT
jgi:hypothetical protein